MPLRVQPAGDHRLLALPIHAIHPDAVVAKDGTGTYTTVNDAVNNISGGVRRYFVIYIKKGRYQEQVSIKRPDVVLIGDGAGETVITNNFSNKTGKDTPHSATLTAEGPGFMARDLTIENTAGAPDDKQAVAFRSISDKSVLYRCEIKGFQDTLFAESHLQFYRDCIISGTVDFVFGDATAMFQNCLILVRRPSNVGQHNVITAQGRNAPENRTGFSFQNCTITTRENLADVDTYLGRPWKSHALVVFMLCSIDDIVHPHGWVSWKKGEVDKPTTRTVVYREYKNHGLGANVSRRITEWPGVQVIKRGKDAAGYTAGHFINGRSWLPQTGVKYYLGLYN